MSDSFMEWAVEYEAGVHGCDDEAQALEWQQWLMQPNRVVYRWVQRGPWLGVADSSLGVSADAPDSALGRCPALIQCHLETGHEGDHEPDPGPFAQQRAAVLARCEQAPRKAPSGDYMRLVADIRAVLGAPPIEQSPNAFGGSADA
jgi:hypothetical protein